MICFPVLPEPSGSTLHTSSPADSIMGLLAMNSTNKVKSSSHNEADYCLARPKTSAPPSLTCTKVEKPGGKNTAKSNIANKMCCLESLCKEYLSEVSSSFT